MGFKFIPFLVTLEINLLLGIFVLVTRRSGLWARVFVALCLAVSIWCAGGFAYYISGNDPFWLQVSLLGVLIIPAVFHYYLAQAYNLRSFLGRVPVLVLLIAATLAMRLFPFDRLGVPARYSYVLNSSAFWLYFVFLYTSFFLGLRTAFREEKSAERKKEIGYEFWSTSIPFALLLVQTVLYHFVPRVPYPNISFSSILGAELVLYAFLSMGRVKAEELLSEGMIYLVYLVLISSVVSLVLFLVDRVSDLDFTAAQYFVIILVTSLAALVFTAARDQVRYIVERSFFPEKYEYRMLIERYERELSEMERRLKETERLAVLGEVAAQVAHEIRNPLGPIKGYAQMFLHADEKSPPSPDLVNKGLTIIAEEVNKIEERVEKLLQFSRPASHKMTRIDLRRLVEQTVALFRFNPSFSDDLRIKLDLENGLELFGERAMLESALYNLILNAAQACGGSGTIRVSTMRKKARAADWIAIEVSDDGPGIEPDLQGRLFEPFFTRRNGGVGLGLCIVKRVVDEHRGWIDVSSEPGRGVCFSIYLPAGPQKEDRDEAQDIGGG